MKSFLIFVLSLLSILGISNPKVANASYGQACFYRDINFGGDYFCLTSGQEIADLSTVRGWNDQISSITIEGQISALVCWDAGFIRCETVTGTLSNLFNLNGHGNWNDQISSIRILDFPPVRQAQACFYRDINYGGDSFCLNRGESIQDLSRQMRGWNDQISSIELRGRLSVTVCWDAGFVRCETVYGNQSNLFNLNGHGNWNDQISSIIVN